MSQKRKPKITKRRTDFRYNEMDERSILEDILSFLSTFLICGLIIVIVSYFIVKPANVSGRSMQPTLENGQKGFANILAVMQEGIQRQDIVLAKIKTEKGNDATVVKRVIGLPGETIECKDEIIYIDGNALDESEYLDTPFQQDWYETNGYFNTDFKKVKLKDDEYFLMGDNRPISLDSRDVGPFKESKIIAKDFLVIYPLSQIAYHH